MSGLARDVRAISDAVVPVAMTDRSAVVVANIFGVIGVLIFIIQPGYVQALVDRGGISVTQAGYVASAEMSGFALSTILLAFLTHKLPWRPLLIAFLLLQAIGNSACVLDNSPVWLSGARLVAGIGAGGLSSLSFTAIGATRDPDRQFGFLIVWILLYGAIGLFALPALLDVAGLNGLHGLATLLTLVGLPLVRFMPCDNRAGDEAQRAGPTLSRTGRALSVVSIYLFFVACAMLWAYLSLIGDQRGLGIQAVANALAMSQFTGIAGALVAGLSGTRFGRSGPLIGSILLCAGSAAALDWTGPGKGLLFATAICLFNFAWNLGQPVYLASAANFDRSGRLVSLMVAGQACGLAAGPFTGAMIGGERPGTGLIVVASGLFLLAVATIVGPFIEHARHTRRLS